MKMKIRLQFYWVGANCAIPLIYSPQFKTVLKNQKYFFNKRIYLLNTRTK